MLLKELCPLAGVCLRAPGVGVTDTLLLLVTGGFTADAGRV
jgi:hypothetical protein